MRKPFVYIVVREPRSNLTHLTNRLEWKSGERHGDEALQRTARKDSSDNKTQLADFNTERANK